ncbi:DUF3800 domain-containing protein [Sphingomonas yantingensis]|uniref:DUF3800 domain-containing protein n=1 Tax=Sphingomonas yantingensis TaxID=1241761 RepID=A0A7W9AT92_9SPHN|nr:DUF3800 domain-containing protein [Sphingomonas yantingensis]MBB5699996.1 hypothetical protein [Sphingomonas yantingensis]
MAHSFIAYIDEAGDDGLNPDRYRVPGRGGGSSHWLTIGATVWRQSRDLDAVRWAKEIREQLPQQKKHKPLHYKDFDHAQRVMAITGLCDRPMRATAVIANKPIIPAGMYEQKNQLYHYMCRYLLERLSWLCRDMRPMVPEGDGRVKIVFSRRRAMNYDDFQHYIQRLKDAADPEIRIHWPVIDISAIEAEDHGSRFGLQIADLVMSGLTAALEPDFYGNVEPRFARMLKPIVYSRGGNYLSYGAKIVPNADTIPLTEQQREFLAIFG